jgi:hypothetical protein
MAKARRVVRKVQPGGGRYFDEQFWPVCIALVVLGAFLMGVSAAYLPLTGGVWYRTAWPSLVGIPLLVAALIVAFVYVDSRLVRRSMQLSIVLGAIVHVAFIVHMVETRIFASRSSLTSEPDEIIERRPPKVTREYHPSQLLPDEDRPRQDFERPLETATPEPTYEPEQIVRQPTEQERSPPEPQPVPVPEQMRTVEPNVVHRQAANEVAPRLAAQSSRLSRQMRPSDVRMSQTVETPQMAQQSAAAVEMRASAAAVARQQSQPTAALPHVEAPSTPTESTEPSIARRTEQRSPTPETTATPTLPRSLAEPAATPHTQVATADRPSPALETAPDAIAPANTSAVRRTTTSPQVAERLTEPTPELVRQPAAEVQRRQSPEPQQPQVAEAGASQPRRRPAPSQPDVASTATPAPQAARSPSTETTTSVAEATPRASTVRRAAAEVSSLHGPMAGRSTADAADAASVSRQPDAARMARATSRAAATPAAIAAADPSAAAGGLARRAVATAPVERSPTAVDSPALAAASAGAADPAAQPAPTAISRSLAGTAGAARSPNFDSSLPAGPSPSLVASGAARRAESTQSAPPGDALSPSAQATISRARAGANVPTAPQRAEAVEIATTAGSTQVAEVTASSSAALTRADAAARSDAVTAARGTGEIDLGPTQVVAEAGAGRASGGGQPQPSLSQSQPQIRRTTAGGAPLASLATTAVGDVAAPAGTGGGAPPQAEPSPAVAGIGRTTSAAAAGGAGPAAPARDEDATSSDAAAAPAAALARATASSDEPGLAESAGGGTDLPRREAAGPALRASTTAEQIALAGAPSSSGSPRGAPLEAQGLEPARLAGGAAGPATDLPLGAVEGPETIDADRVGLAGNLPGRRQASPSEDDGPSISDLVLDGAPASRPAAPAMASSTIVEDIPEVGPMSAVAQAELDHMLPGAAPMPMSRPAGEAIAVSIDAPEGPGGLGSDITPEVGINARQAREESLNVQMRSARFVRSEVGGLPSVSTAAIVASDAFSSRAARVRGETPAGGSGTPSPQTEAAIERGLAFLARYQRQDGSWSLQGFPEEAQLASDTAATALCVIAFQGAGYNHREFQYKDVVRAGLDYLVQGQKENGDLFVPLDDESNRSVWLYSHSLAAIALCEAYGMTHDPALREPAQLAIDFIVASQHPQRGGWRYSPGVSSDTSVSGWMMMALKSGELAGLDVPQDSYRKIDRWLDLARQSPTEPYLYRYNPYAPDTPEQRHGLTASKTMTSVGLLMRLYGGWKRDNVNMQRGAQFLAANLPAIGTAREPQRDTYYWYYATQVMAHMGGDYWQAWNARLHPLLLDSQVQFGPYAGSWDPLRRRRDRQRLGGLTAPTCWPAPALGAAAGAALQAGRAGHLVQAARRPHLRHLAARLPGRHDQELPPLLDREIADRSCS